MTNNCNSLNKLSYLYKNIRTELSTIKNDVERIENYIFIFET